MIRFATGLGVLVTLAACNVAEDRRGTPDCGYGMTGGKAYMTGTTQAPVRCGPQSEPYHTN